MRLGPEALKTGLALIGREEAGELRDALERWLAAVDSREAA